MKISVDFSKLKELKERMGAGDSDWRLHPESSPRGELLDDLAKGIVVDNIQEVYEGPCGLLTYKGEQVLLYIKDTQSTRWTLENEPEKSRRFHIAECKTLEDMRNAGRFERYVVTRRTDGWFKADWRDKKERGTTEARLKVCMNCLDAISWQGYNQRYWDTIFSLKTRRKNKEIWENFSIEECLMEYSTFFPFRPSRTDITAELNKYPKDWQQIARREKERAGWCCAQCGVDLSHHKKSLHCHHKSGVVTDNSPSNLVALCALCHARQPYHGHMTILSSTQDIINQARREQGIPIT